VIVSAAHDASINVRRRVEDEKVAQSTDADAALGRVRGLLRTHGGLRCVWERGFMALSSSKLRRSQVGGDRSCVLDIGLFGGLQCASEQGLSRAGRIHDSQTYFPHKVQ